MSLMDASSLTRWCRWWEWLIIPLRYLLLISLMIPISLKVSIDVVKYAYAMFINWDAKMYDIDVCTTANCYLTPSRIQ